MMMKSETETKKKSRRCLNYFRNKSRLYRYGAMINICLLGLGGFVCFDSVGSLQEALMKYLELSSSDFSLMYSVNAWPNIVLCLFGGFLIDRFFGIEWGAIIYSVIFSIGHLIFSLGVLIGTFWLAILGRFIFGIGLEVMFICLQCYVIVWFQGKELSMVISLMFSISRLGTSIVYELASPLYSTLKAKVEEKQAIGLVYLIIGVTAFISVGFGFILKSMNPKKYDKESNDDINSDISETHGDAKKISLRDVLHFPATFWTISVCYCVFITTVFVLVPFSQGFFIVHFNLTIEAANNVTSFFAILSAVVAPFLGMIVDRVGRTISFLLGGMICSILAHLLLTFSSASPFIGMFFMSIGLALFVSSISPMLAFIIPQHQLGTAFGVNMSLTNISYSINLLVAGALVDNYSFTAMELYMIAWTLLGLFTSILLWYQDKVATGVLNMSPQQRKQFVEAEKKKNDLSLPLKTSS